MGFEPQIRQILSLLPDQDNRQNLFFTATWPKEVQQLARTFLKNPVHVEIGDQNQLNANKAIKQIVRFMRQFDKDDELLNILVSLSLRFAKHNLTFFRRLSAGGG